MPPDELAHALRGEICDEGLVHIRRSIRLAEQPDSLILRSLQCNPGLPGDAGTSGLRCIYIDTETTGLSGGSGTLAFLVGLAFVDDDAITTRQLLMTRFSAEAALLAALARLLSPGDRLISYNGKSYDLPLLMTRFRMQGQEHPLGTLPHLDLLHPVRRLFGKHWKNCRLITLEENLLGIRRVDDLPGAEAPAAWFRYIRHGDGSQLARIVEHNRQDILSLAFAHSLLARAVERPRDFGVDIHALARWLAETDESAAIGLLRSHAGRLCDEGMRLLGQLSRRTGNWKQAVSVWETLAANGCVNSLECLAKYHEHVSRDLAAARRCCERLPRNAAQGHRRRRIDAKMEARENRLRKHPPAESCLPLIAGRIPGQGTLDPDT